MLTQTQLRTATASQPRLNSTPRPAPTRGDLGAMELMGTQMTFGPNEEIFGENEPTERVYKVTKGAVRTYKILNDGRRQIGAFYFPGDIFGLEARKLHTCSAETITRSLLQAIKLTELLSHI